MVEKTEKKRRGEYMLERSSFSVIWPNLVSSLSGTEFFVLIMVFRLWYFPKKGWGIWTKCGPRVCMAGRSQYFKWLLSFKGSHLKWKHHLSFPFDAFSQTLGRTHFWLAYLPWLPASLATLVGHSFQLMTFGAHVVRQLNKVRFNALCPEWWNHNSNKRNPLQLSCNNTKW